MYLKNNLYHVSQAGNKPGIFTRKHAHTLAFKTYVNPSSWFCDGRRLPGGCLAKEDVIGKGKRYRCTEGCDFDLCEACMMESSHFNMKNSKHEHNLSFSTRLTSWKCDGRKCFPGGCLGNEGGLPQYRYRCTEGCDFDLCLPCTEVREISNSEREKSLCISFFLVCLTK
jgi:hypothetical protein